MSFLTIPSQAGLFTTVKTGRETEEGNSPVDEDEDEETQNIRLIPRCSPVPRKRGQSIFDEDAEYLRIRLAQPDRRVSFADTTGGDLVYVKEFVAFDSDEEDDARWEEEEAKYRRPHREPSYRVRPEFDMPTTTGLTHAIHTSKVEVELVSPVEDEPLAFHGIIRVLNISFKKAVYIRSTMDSWGTYFDYPAEYVEGSNDGETDRFSFKLSFAPPYLTHGSRIEFVVRFETPEGDYWANNSGRNYVVTLLLSYEELAHVSAYAMQDIKGILKPAKIYSMKDDSEEDSDQDEGGPESSLAVPGIVRPTPVCPVIIHPDIDVETADDTPSSPRLPPNPDHPSADGTLSSATVSLAEQSHNMSSITTPQTTEDPSVASQDNQPLQPSEPELLPEQGCELDDQTQEEPRDRSLSTHLPTPTAPPSGTLTVNTPEPDTVTDLLHPDTELLHIVSDAPLTDLTDAAPDLTLKDSDDNFSDPPHTVIDALHTDSIHTNNEPTLFVTDSIHVVADVPNADFAHTDLADVDTSQKDTRPDDPGVTVTDPRDTVTNPRDTVTDPGVTVTDPCDTVTNPRDTVTNPRDTVTNPCDTVTDSRDTVTDPCDTVTDSRDTVTDPRDTVTAPPHIEIQANVPSLNYTANEYDFPATSGEETEEAESQVHWEEEEVLRPEEEKGAEEREELSIRTQELVTSLINLPEQHSAPDTGISPKESSSSSEESEKLTQLKDGYPTMEPRPGEEVEAVPCMWHPPLVTHLGPTGEDGVTPTLPNRGDSDSAGTGKLADSALSLLQEEKRTPAVESPTPLGAGRITAPGFTDNGSVSEGSTDVQYSTPQDYTLRPPKADEEEDDSFEVAPVTLGNLPSGLSEAPKLLNPECELTTERSLIASITFLTLAICLAVGLQQPSLFLFMGLLLISLYF